MDSLLEDTIASKLAAWLDTNRPPKLPPRLPIHVANRDELRTRPCVVLATSDVKPVVGMRHTARVKLDVHLFSQVDDTTAEQHTAWAAELAGMLAQIKRLRGDLDSETFCLHDLLARESATTPDEARGRETVLTFEAVASGIG